MRWIALVAALAGCATAPAPPHAVVTASIGARAHGGTILVLPTTQDSVRSTGHGDQATGRFAAPMLLLKLQLAGYTIVDASALRLVTAEREEITNEGGTYVSGTTERVTPTPTVADLSADEQSSLAHTLGLTGVLRTHVIAVYAEDSAHPDHLELRAELVAGDRVLWNVTCSDHYDTWETTLSLLGTCVGDGILAWRAPEAIATRIEQ